MHKYLIIGILLFFSNNVSALDWTLRLFSPPNGEAFEEVRDIRVDNNGVVWFSSWGNGIAKMDGSDWITYTKEDGLISNFIPAIEIDETGGVWAATEYGISYIAPNGEITNYTQSEIPLIDNNSLNEVYRLSNNEIWFCTDSGSIIGCCDDNYQSTFVDTENIFQYNGMNWYVVKEALNIDGDSVYQILEANDSTVWIAQDSQGILFLRDRKWNSVSPPGLEGRIRSVFEDSTGKIWSVGSSIVYYDQQQWNLEIEESGALITGTPNDTLFCVDEFSVRYRSENGWNKITYPRDFGEPTSRCFQFVNDQHGWIGTKEGIIEVVQNPFVQYKTSRNNNEYPGSTFYTSLEVNPLLVNQQYELMQYTGQKWIPLISLPVNYSLRIKLSEAVQNQIWVLDDQFVYHISLTQKEILQTIPVPLDLQIENIFYSSQGNLFLYGAGGIFKLEGDEWNPFVENNVIVRDILQVEESNNQQLILCKKYSVEWWDEHKKTKVGNYTDKYISYNFKDHPFTFATESKDGMLWVGTRGMGILAGLNGSLNRISTNDGLMSNRIVDFYEASNGVFWIASENVGVSSFDGKRWVHFSHDKGIGSDEIDKIYEDPNGSIWVTTLKQSNIYYYISDTNAPDTSIINYPKTIPHNGFGIFTYEGYDFWNHTPVHELVYSWRIVNKLSGEVTIDWSNYTTETSTKSPVLHPGEYRFEVKASEYSRLQDPTPDFVEFTVLPIPVTNQPWFFPLVVFVLLLTLFMSLFAMISRRQVTVYANNLESLVKDRTNELSNANDNLTREIEERKQIEIQLLHSQKMDAIGKLTGGIAHDFNNILTGLIGFTDILQDEIHKEDPNRMCVDEIKKACIRASDLTQQLLAFSRKQVLKPIVLNLNSHIIETKSMIERLIHERINIELDLDESIHMIEMDPSKLEQVILNLTVNATDAMPNGGTIRYITKMKAFDTPTNLSTSIIQPGNYVLLMVQDTGVGICADVLQHIFEPFFTTKGSKGTGLGLSTTYGIIDQSDGFIEVESKENAGSTFSIFLPASEDQVKSPENIYTPNSISIIKTVLIVDDEEMIVILMKRALQKAGYVVLEATTAEDAYTLFMGMEGTLDLLVTDVVLPGLSGKELSEKIQKVYTVPTIYMSGYNNEIVSEHGVLNEDITYLQKPFESKELLQKAQSLFHS